MSKRRIDPGKAKDIARERMDRLMSMAVDEASAGNKDRARRYVLIARRIGMKTRTHVPLDIRYCKECGIPLVPGTTCRIRIGNHKVTMSCLECGSARRFPYIKEQR